MSDEELAVVRDALDIAGFKAQAISRPKILCIHIYIYIYICIKYRY